MTNKELLKAARESRQSAQRAEKMAKEAGNGERYQKIYEKALREARETESQVKVQLQKLNAVDRLTLELWLDGATFEEIGATMGWTSGWANHRFNEAIKKL